MSVVNNDTQVLKNYVGGKWVDTAGQKFGEVINPSTGEVIAKVPLSTKEDVANAVETAQKTFETWRNVPAPKRARLMFAFQHLLVKHHEELAKLVVQENGKAFKEAYGEVQRGIECVEFAAGAPTLLMGESLNNIAEEIDSEMFRFPLGVVGGITPFNFPMMVPLWMFPLAIVCGNTFVLKPSERTPLLATRLAELFTEAGAPDGLLNIVHGAHDVVNGLIEHEKVKAISFVGSQPVAKYVYEQAAAQGKRVQALSGAKNHHVVMPDCDMDKAVSHIISSAYGSAGQRCMACSAVVVVGEKGDEFVAKLKQKADELIMGSGFDDEVLLTPVIRKEHRDKVLDYIELGMKEGAELIRDGRKEMDEHTEGNFLGATIFDRVTPDMTIAKEEIFAPVLSLLRADTLDEALRYMEKSRFGNGATIYTKDAKAVRQFREEADAGMLGINVGVPATMAFFPFSGWKDSFYGDLHVNGKDGLNFFTRKKMVTSRFDF
ncbi:MULTISPECIES: CoA-acylating methylmalonate-semialdehyde dehydrogenase [Priestia]|uniref:Malonate-semialdehyde dehydrogenase n=1 Tax=Priestia aryabhattai TaxID=412384 RepID=A0ABD5KXI7_PRIAR|nr:MULTISPECIES: CoA-acylating methylmalonate-semialdehyde dehydrogenase [Priestia]MBK0293100.1 CoA-acylating methylmalonate-semialdehyde dehydrogenase [Bacillus sp. S34]UPK50835.1 CoA-acylating methylmalonate-semialdehyde dehydrogenase [Bacillus sp. H8-1]AWD64222.1 methylmalonate-semialdehyde dehydrogenase (CoA acylating) [Priestia megaterium]MCQ9280162.1 CoA-acylating methylmalonate-semialdehyde dehydrogenase [Priestia aryabhattai]MDC7766233.1 CoA-acylating methylmalonate-semialdehyde dehydr